MSPVETEMRRAPDERGQTAEGARGRDARKGIVLGLITAAIFCAWATFVRVTAGESAFSRMGASYTGTMATYLVTCTVAGGIIGGLKRFYGTRGGAYATGFVAGLPIVLAIMLQQAGYPWQWSEEERALAPVLLLVATIAIGSEIRRRHPH